MREYMVALQASIMELLAKPNIRVGRADAAGKSLDVLTLLRWSFDQLLTKNHRQATHVSKIPMEADVAACMS
jgi:hypothetical protein